MAQSTSGVLRNAALVDDNVLFRIIPGGKKCCGDFPCRFRQFFWILRQCDRMHVHDAIDAIIGLLQRHKFANGPKIVAQMQVPGWLDTGENERSELSHDVTKRNESHLIDAAYGPASLQGQFTQSGSTGGAPRLRSTLRRSIVRSAPPMENASPK